MCRNGNSLLARTASSWGSVVESHHSLGPASAPAIVLAVVALLVSSCATGSSATAPDDNDSARTIRPLLGVNGGPTPFQQDLYPKSVDTTDQFQSLGVNAVRMVDYFSPNSIMCMFPDPSADPSIESNYEFEATDAAFQAIIDGNFRPMLRLGQDWKVGEAVAGYDVQQPTGGLFPDKPTAYPDCEFWG